MNVLGLVKKRRERLGYNFKRVEIDVSIVQRIHKLFNLACWRFQGDEKIWFSHIEFCKKKNEKVTIGRLFTKMLQIHNRKPDLWVAAAKWEMEDNLSMENARGLLQRALRFNPQSQQLWLEYYRMELLNADKLNRRKEILGLAHMDMQENIPDAVTEGQVALLVYRKAEEEIPGNLEFCLKFLPITRLFSFASKVEEEIFSCLENKFSDHELMWHAKATRQLPRIPKLIQESKNLEEAELQITQIESECVEVFEKAVREKQSERMWCLYIETCLKQIDMKSSSSLKEERICRTLKVMERASSSDFLSLDLALKWIELLKECGQVGTLSHVTQGLLEGRHKDAVSLWTERLLWLARDEHHQFYTEWLTAISTVNPKEALPLFEIGLQWAFLYDQDQVEAILKRGLSSDAVVCSIIKEKYLEWSAARQGIDETKKLYKSLSSGKPLSLDFFIKYISVLNSQPEPNMKRLRKVYEDAVLEYGDRNSDLWLDFIQLEQTHPKGKPGNATNLHWRAMKMLDSSLIERFTAQYTLMQSEKL